MLQLCDRLATLNVVNVNRSIARTNTEEQLVQARVHKQRMTASTYFLHYSNETKMRDGSHIPDVESTLVTGRIFDVEGSNRQ